MIATIGMLDVALLMAVVAVAPKETMTSGRSAASLPSGLPPSYVPIHQIPLSRARSAEEPLIRHSRAARYSTVLSASRARLGYESFVPLT
jgi:hypothetical protein